MGMFESLTCAITSSNCPVIAEGTSAPADTGDTATVVPAKESQCWNGTQDLQQIINYSKSHSDTSYAARLCRAITSSSGAATGGVLDATMWCPDGQVGLQPIVNTPTGTVKGSGVCVETSNIASLEMDRSR